MKKLIYLIQLILIMTFFVVTGCKKDSEGLSKITYLPTFQMSGPQYYFLIKGTAWVDPGVTCAGGEKVTIVGEVDDTTLGLYRITYLAINKDSVSATTFRNVIITDALPTAASDLVVGKYKNLPSGKEMEITKTVLGVYHLTDVYYHSSGTKQPADIVYTGGTSVTLVRNSNTIFGIPIGQDPDVPSTFDVGTGTLTIGILFDDGTQRTKTWTKQ